MSPNSTQLENFLIGSLHYCSKYSPLSIVHRRRRHYHHHLLPSFAVSQNFFETMSNRSESSSENIPTAMPVTVTVTVPDIAIQWIVKYSCDTNSNLAAVSNVNRHWRSLVCEEVGAFLRGVHDNLISSPPATGNNNSNSTRNRHSKINSKESEQSQLQSKQRSPSLSNNNNSNSNSNSNNYTCDEYKHISNLLLPNMAIEVLRRSRSDYTRSAAALDASSSFCLSWFPPEGIKVQPVNLNECYSDEDIFSSDSSSSDDDENCEINFYRQRLHQKANMNMNMNMNMHNKSGGRVNDDDVPCSNEWQGYRGAMDVLLPLGYSTAFVQVRF